MKVIHATNSALWFANALMWAFYAHSPFMGAVGFAVSIITAIWYRKFDAWDFR